MITQEELTGSLLNRVSGSSATGVNNVAAVINPSAIQIVLKSDRGNSTIDAQVAAENGRLVVTKLTSSDWALRRLIPNDKLTAAIEDGANAALASQSLRLTDLTLEAGRIILTTAPA